MKLSILAAVHDPGGAKALAPILSRLGAHRGVKLTVLAGTYARSWLKEQKIVFHPIESNLSSKEASTWFEKIRPDRLITATSWNSNAEQMLRNEAFLRKVPSSVVMDFWSSYKARWTSSLYSISQLPDTVFALDSAMRREMIDEGFPSSKIIATGHPHLESLQKRVAPFRLRPASKPRTTRILFLSERLTPALIQQFPEHPLRIIFEAVADWSKTQKRKIQLHFKPHPKEVMDPVVQEIIQSYAPRIPLETLTSEQPFLSLLPRYDFVIGYQSMGLIEANAMGKNVLAFPVLLDNLPLLRAFRSMKLPNYKISHTAVTRALTQAIKKSHSSRKRLYAGATQKIIKNVLNAPNL